jgi:hypothetical protein
MKLGVEMSLASVRADVLALLREKRYEELLALLYKARTEAPKSVELQKSIVQVKAFLIGMYAERLGGLDQVPQPLPVSAGRSPDVVLLSRYVDGISTHDDIAQVCPLGRIKTLQLLVEVYAPAGRSGLVPLVDVSEPRSEERLQLNGVPDSAVEASTTSSDEPVPETVRRVVPEAALPINDPIEQEYRRSFAAGTAAYIQCRYADAVSAFEACIQLRVGDARAEVMLRRSRHDLESSLRQ